MAKQKKENKDEIVDSAMLTATAFFKNNKSVIYNNPSKPYKVSTGVYGLDAYLDGGIDSGTQVRFLGPPTGGKSSEALLVMMNFLQPAVDGVAKRRALAFPTEARLTEKLKARAGIKFVEDPEQWENGTCLIIPTNVYDKIANFIVSLVKTNRMKNLEERENFYVFIDCMDYLILQDDLEKEIGEARRVAGPQYLTKMLWSSLALPFNEGQHIAALISQQSAAPKIDKYAKDPLRQGGSSGGTNIQYQASTVLDFSGRYEGDYLLEYPEQKYDPKNNKKIGHTVKGYLRKSDNEAYDVQFEYKVKYGRTGGNSVWIESDICDWLVSFELLYRETGKGAWFTVRESIRNEILPIKADVPEKFQGLDNFRTYLEENTEVTQLLYNKMLESLAPVEKNDTPLESLE